MNTPSPLLVYGLLAVIGVLGAVGDALIYKAATGTAPVRPLVRGFAVWMLAIALVYVYFRLDRHGFTAAVLIMIVVHAASAAIADWWFFGGHIGRREVFGFLLALGALIALEGGESRTEPQDQLTTGSPDHE